jgi:hypothetical protein
MSETMGFENGADERARALDVGVGPGTRDMTNAERDAVVARGMRLAEKVGGIWLLISGRFTSDNGALGTEGLVRELLRREFGYPQPDGPHLTVNVLLDSPGGSLDSAYSTALYLSAYAKPFRVYVPGRAKSASTLLALGADELYLSVFGELGPLDTQLRDPRNPARHVSALDCYQSVDYVRAFGIRTMTEALETLIEETGGQVPVSDLLERASVFALGAIAPMLRSVGALDFGGWGRSLRIGERYTRKLLAAKSEDVDEDLIRDIARRLVFSYTHHLFPIDYHEARRLQIPVQPMDGETYDEAIEVVRLCAGKDFVGFISKEQSDPGERTLRTNGRKEPVTVPRQDNGHPNAQAARNGDLDLSTDHPSAVGVRRDAGMTGDLDLGDSP